MQTVYMRGDPHLSLFMSYLSLFTFSCLFHVCGDNSNGHARRMGRYWCSFLLIGYTSSLLLKKAHKKAILVNPVSDGMFYGVFYGFGIILVVYMICIIK
jgi:NADH:ubiquinone oxidoreductase subunit 5 (subunit L)/multisubunit Na+/H+ antiporter MnhA subunit